MLHRLEIRDLRNLQSVSMPELGRINLLCGSNGSGKTSVLEAIHLLGLGRPMRSRGIQPVIRHGTEQCVVSAELQPSSAGRGITRLGLSRHQGGDATVRINGEAAISRAKLLRELPLQLIDARVASLLSGAPAGRRRFMDWCTFHMEPHFLQQWRRYHRCLKQYNRLLRNPIQASALAQRSGWIEQLAEAGEALAGMRANWAETFSTVLATLQPSQLATEVKLRYMRGWSSGGSSFIDCLSASWAKDRAAAHLRQGPHCADLRFSFQGAAVADRLSSGQLKALAIILRLAAAQQLQQQCGLRCVFLVDDLSAELDRHAKRTLCNLLDQSGHQIFASCIERSTLHSFLPTASRCDFQLRGGGVSQLAA